MTTITLIALENMWPSNNFNLLVNKMKPSIHGDEMVEMKWWKNIVFYIQI